MYPIYFMKIETHGKLPFYCSDFGAPLRPAATTYKKDGAQHTTILGILGILGIFRWTRDKGTLFDKINRRISTSLTPTFHIDIVILII